MIRIGFLLLLSTLMCCTPAPDPEAELQALAAQLLSDTGHAVLAALQPKAADYEALFREVPAVNKARAYGEAQWADSRNFTPATLSPLPAGVTLQVITVSSIALQTGRSSDLPADYYRLAPHLKTGTLIYALQYLNPDSTVQQWHAAFFRVADRWVFIPDPYRAFE